MLAAEAPTCYSGRTRIQQRSSSMQNALPLRKRPLDLILLIYFIFNLVAISYFFDIEQIVS